MRRPSGVRGSSCRLRGAPTGSSNAACPSRKQDAGACPARAGVAAPRIRRATWAAGLPPSAAPAQERGTDRSFACPAKRLFDVAYHVGTPGGSESEESRIQLGVTLKRLEPEHRGLSETVDKFHDFETGRTEAHSYLLEIAFLVPRQRFEPFETVPCPLVRERECPHGLVISREQRSRRGTERLVEFPHRDLLQIVGIGPNPGAVADDGLGIGPHVVPARLPRPRKRERAA